MKDERPTDIGLLDVLRAMANSGTAGTGKTKSITLTEAADGGDVLFHEVMLG